MKTVTIIATTPIKDLILAAVSAANLSPVVTQMESRTSLADAVASPCLLIISEGCLPALAIPLEEILQLLSCQSDIDVIWLRAAQGCQPTALLQAGIFRYLGPNYDEEELALIIKHHLSPESSTIDNEAPPPILDPRQISSAFASITDLLQLDEIYQITCRVAVELFQVDRSILLVFDENKQTGEIKSAYPESSSTAHDIQLYTRLFTKDLFKSKTPISKMDSSWANGDHALHSTLKSLNIDTLLIVPIIIDNNIHGFFSLDLIAHKKQFTSEEIALCQTFADQVGQAIARANERQSPNRKAQSDNASNPQFFNQNQLAQTIVSHAVAMFDAQGGGLYRLHRDLNSLELIADIRPQASLAGTTLTVGEGGAGHLIATKKSHLIIHDYEQWSNPAPIYAGKRFFGAVLEVPLRYDGELIGVLFVDDSVGRRFTLQDAHLLQFFADQAAAAWHHARQSAIDSTRVHRLEILTQASADIMRRLGTTPLHDLLTLIAQHAAETLDAEACSVLLVRRPGYLTFEAAYGYQTNNLPIGREFAIQTGAKSGLTGHIAHEAKLYNAHGDELRNHHAVRGEETPLVASNVCHAILAIPLQRNTNNYMEIVGLLRVENKKDSQGNVRDDLAFDHQDEWILKLLADAILIAIENAELVADLDAQRDQLAKLLSTTPTAVVANDPNGRIFFANSKAENILGRTESDLLDTPVVDIFADEKDAREISRLLISNDDHLDGHNVLLRHHNGTSCPVRLTATRLYNNHGQMIGTVGHFEDLSTIHETRRQLEWLLTASNELTQADSLPVGLQRLSNRIAQLQPINLCSLWTITKDQSLLKLQAITPESGQIHAADRPTLYLPDYPDLSGFLHNEEEARFQINHPGCVILKNSLTSMLPFNGHSDSGLLLPLRVADRIVGFAFLLLAKDWNHKPQANDFMHLIVSIAEQIALLIDRLMAFQTTEQREQLLSALDEATQVMRAELPPVQLWREMVRLATELTGCTAGGLFLNSPLLGELKLVAVYNLPDTLLGTQLKHGEGMIGQAALAEQLVFTNHFQDRPSPDSFLAQFQFQTVVAIPLQEKVGGDMTAMLVIADTERSQHITKLELSVLDRFAAQASVTLHTANLINSEKRALDHLGLLHRISNYVQTTDNLDNVLHVFLTGVTAGYGLGFNCSAIMLTDTSQNWLAGASGIGHLQSQNAEAAWNESHATGLYQFDSYRNKLEEGLISTTPIGQRIRQVSIPLETEGSNPFVTVIETRKCVVIEPDAFHRLPSSFLDAFQPATAIVIAPLIVRDKTIGVLVADNRYTHVPITRASLERILTFASSAAIAIDKTRLLYEIKMAQNRLQAFYSASQSLVSTEDPVVVLQKIAEKAQVAAQAVWVNLILIDVPGHSQRMVHSHKDAFVPPTIIIREHGLSMSIMQSGKEIVIGDLLKTSWPVHPETLNKPIKAVAGFPLVIRGRRIGVMWIHYDEPHQFSPAELEALKLFVNQAAIAYDNALHIRSLDRMRQASQELAGATSLDSVLNKITNNALQVLEADSAAVWSFDEERGQFLLQAWTGDESSNLIWEHFHQEAPSPDGMAHHIMTNGWLGVDSIADNTKHPYLSTQTRANLKDIGVASFQGVVLQVGEEKLGVLYINYQLPQIFTSEVQKEARTFAAHSALALKKVKLLEGYRHTRDIAQVVASMTVLESLEETLNEVLAGTKTALNCDAITLYIYDAQLEVVKPYPVMLGVNNHSAAMQLPQIPEHSIVYQILEKHEMYIVEDTNQDRLFSQSRFTNDEGIATCVALPLRINQEPVGALFVNYRAHHRFTSDELDNIRLFGNQAAVAIHNAQLYQREQSRHRALVALYETSQTIAVSLNLDEILSIIIQQAWYIVRYQEKQVSYGSIWLVQNESQAKLVATYPLAAFDETKENLGDYIDLKSGTKGRIGIIGRACQIKKAILVPDVRKNKDYLETRQSTRSALVVPIIEGDQVVGVINLEHEAVDAFKPENIESIETLANQAAIAIRNGRLFEQTVKHARLLDAAAQVASHAITILDEDKLLRETVELITSQLEFYHAAVFLLEQNSTIARLRAASSPGGKMMLKNNFFLSIGEGIVGRVARRGEPYLVSDISQDAYHLENPLLPHTRAEKAFPLIARGEVIGVLDVQSQQSITLQPEEVSALQTMANQLANAIHNAQLYTEVNRRAVALQSLQEAGQVISSSLDLNNVLNNIVEQAWRLTGTHGPTAQFSCLTLVKENGTKLEFVAAYPKETLASLKEKVGGIDITVAHHGIMGRAVHEKRPQLIGDVIEEPAYISFDKNILSELAIPIILNGVVIGVINVEHPTINAFDKEDVQNLTTLAANAAVAIDKADSFRKLQDMYDELQRTHRMMEARTAVACMGMASSIWGHDISNHAQVIKEQLILLERDLQEFGLLQKDYAYRLDMISRSAEMIRQKPLTLPLRSEEAMSAVFVNDLVGERTRQLWQNSPYREIELNFDFQLNNRDSVLASAEWLRRVLDILLDNAVDAMQNTAEKIVILRTQLKNGLVEIAVIDTGRGLPPDIQEKIGIEYIERAEDAKGLGMGLLMAQIITQAYEGQLKVEYTGPQGTSILILLPLHKELP